MRITARNPHEDFAFEESACNARPHRAHRATGNDCPAFGSFVSNGGRRWRSEPRVPDHPAGQAPAKRG